MQVKTKTENSFAQRSGSIFWRYESILAYHISISYIILVCHASPRNPEHELAQMMTSHCKKQ